MLFRYHSGEKALVFPDAKTGKMLGIKLSTLVALGWKVSHDGLSKLPRFDAQRVEVQPASRMQALDYAAQLASRR